MLDNTVDKSWLEMYLYESTTMIEQLELIIITCEKEKNFNQENINEIFRIMHTIKGSSSMMMYINIANVAHSLEDLFYYIREEEPKTMDFSIIIDFVLSGIDFMKSEVNKIKDEIPTEGREEELVDQIKSYLIYLKNEENSLSLKKHFHASISFIDGCEMENIRAYTIVHSIPKDMENIYYEPSDILENEVTSLYIKENGFKLAFSTDRDYNEIYQWLINSSFVSEVNLEEINELKTSKDTVVGVSDNLPMAELSEPVNNDVIRNSVELSKINESHSSGRLNRMISVSVDKLDRLLDLIGEIVIAEDMVLQNPDLLGLKLDNFRKAANQLSKITGDIQDLVMEIRMVPLQATFLKMNRIVRDVSKKLEKEVELEIIGEETEVDKKIIELISDPIMHLVRNALDHGIEHAEERIERGKNRGGKITLEAKNEGSDVIIQVRDDGRGLNKDRILLKALEQGLIVKDSNLTEKEIYNLILAPGFSTKEEVTEYSGRGVGMDVVAKNIESIGGSLYVDSLEDKGSTITLRIPLTLAIIDGMNIRVGKSRYTIPTISIKETFRPKGNEIITDPDGNEMIMVRGKCYVIRKLYEMYQVETNVTKYTDGIVVMVEQDERMVAIFADELIGQQQVVVKSLPEYIKYFGKKEMGLVGCTLLGDGSISLIIDVSKMLAQDKNS